MYLYHGSSRKLKVLSPRKATGISKKSDRQNGIYATDKKDRAIAMALIHLKGIIGGTRLSFFKGKTTGIIFEGWPIQKYFYLYTLPGDTFKKIDGWQYISEEKVVPLKVEKLNVKDYLHMIRMGTKKEFNAYNKRYEKFKEKIKKGILD